MDGWMGMRIDEKKSRGEGKQSMGICKHKGKKQANKCEDEGWMIGTDS